MDNTDGDVIAAIEIMGSVDTTTPGVYTLTYVVQDTNGNQAITSRSVVVQAEPVDPTPSGTKPPSVTVGTGNGDTLPVTGADGLWMGAGALALIVVGFGVFLLRREVD